MTGNMGNAIEQMRCKEEAGLNYLYSKTYNYVYLRAKSVLKREDDVQQLMKDVYLQLFHAADSLKEEEVYEWLGKRTYTLGAQSLRKRKAREATFIELEKGDLALRKGNNTAPSIEVIDNVMEELPDLYQATFYAFYYDYMAVADIAEMMDCSIGIILNRLNYTAKYIKKAMEIYNEERKDKKEKAYFSVDIVCAGLRKWSVDHCLGMASAQTLYSNLCKELNLTVGSIYFEGKEFAGVNNTVVYHKTDDLSALLEEIAFYEKKETVDKRKLIVVASVIVALVLLIVIVAAIGGKDENDDAKPPVTEQENPKDDSASEENESETEIPKVDESETDTPETSEPETNTPETSEPESDSEESAPQVSEDYILPTSNTVKLTTADLQSLTKEQLRLARNEIYARHGMIFGVDDLDNYFATKSWYQPKYKSGQFYDEVEMSIIEEENVEFILQAEKSR